MTQDPTQNLRPEPAEARPEKHRLGLSTAQVAGSALAAMSGAFFASWAGVAGTIAGAAAMSVIATVGAATYTWWLRRTAEAMRRTAARTAAQVRAAQRLGGSLPRTVAEGPLREDDETRAFEAEPAPTPDASEEEAPEQGGPWWRRWDLPWGKLAVASLLVLVVGLAGVTVIEAVTGRPLSSLTGHDNSTGTTVGHVVGTDHSPPKRTPTPTPEPTRTTDNATPEPTPSSTPESPAPSTPVAPAPSQSPTVPEPTPTPSESQSPATTQP